MTTISTVTDRSDGEILTAAKYNTDHGVHETNATNLNNDKTETSAFEKEHSAAGVHGDSVLQTLGLTSSDNPHFNSLIATGDQSSFASVDFTGKVTITGDLALVGVTTFATSDFAGGVTMDSLTLRRNAPATFTSSDLGKLFLDMMPNVLVRFDGSPLSISSDVNVESIGDNGVGQYQINFSATMDTDGYTVLATAGQAAGAEVFARVDPIKIGWCQMRVLNSSGAATDSTNNSLIIFGGKVGLP